MPPIKLSIQFPGLDGDPLEVWVDEDLLRDLLDVVDGQEDLTLDGAFDTGLRHAVVTYGGGPGGTPTT